MSATGPHESIDRASPNDMMQAAVDFGRVPMQVGAVLVLDTAPDVDLGAVVDTLGERVMGVPRLRQRLVDTPFGCGRPVWVDDEHFDPAEQIVVVRCPTPGDDAALLALATDVLATRLPAGRAPWRATLVTGLTDDRTALIIVFDHVLADGIGGLAVLASLVDGAAVGPDPEFPRPAPSRRALATDAARQRWRALAGWRGALTRLRAGLTELQPRSRPNAPRTSLNRPTGSRRATRVVRADLEAVHALARTRRATVNDVVLAVVTGALRELLHGRGEEADRFVVSIPISGRRDATSDALGNEVGVLPVALPAAGTFEERVAGISRITRGRKGAGAPRGSSAALVGPVFHALALLHLVAWFMDRQRLINTLVTNVRGPDGRLAFAGAEISDVIPLSVVTGNVTVAFAVLSYAGRLNVTIDADADRCPDLESLARCMQRAFDGLASSRLRSGVG